MRPFLICILFSALGLMSCSSQKHLEEDPPFTVEDPIVQYWVGGREESGSGMLFQARWSPLDPSSIHVDSLFFRGRVLKLEVEDSETGFRLIASRTYKKVEKPDIIMHADPMQEVGNQPPMPLSSGDVFPFELEPDEAVISYIRKSDGKRFYTKIKGISEKADKIFPTRPEN